MQTLMKPAPVITSPYSARVRSLVESAQQKLSDRRLSHRLRVWSHLRLICLAMYQHDLEISVNRSRFGPRNPYLSYLRKLAYFSETWWETCRATSDLVLKSSNPEIHVVLLSIRKFIRDSQQPWLMEWPQ
ncbi:MAG: hypothetical protein ACFB4J_11255 [Elainellaceae cyanobacterium]